MKKILLILGFLVVALPAMAFSEIWVGERCDYNLFLSRCCAGSHLFYYSDGAKTACHFEYNPNVCSIEPKLDLLRYYQDKAIGCPLRIIYRNTGISPISSFGHYEGDILYENTPGNTPAKINPNDDLRSVAIINTPIIDHTKKDNVTTITVNKNITIDDGPVKQTNFKSFAPAKPIAVPSNIPVALPTKPVTASLYNATSLEQMQSQIKQLFAMVLELQKQLAEMKNKK